MQQRSVIALMKASVLIPRLLFSLCGPAVRAGSHGLPRVGQPLLKAVETYPQSLHLVAGRGQILQQRRGLGLGLGLGLGAHFEVW